MDVDFEIPSAKRQKLENVDDAAIAKARGSRLFAPFRVSSSPICNDSPKMMFRP